MISLGTTSWLGPPSRGDVTFDLVSRSFERDGDAIRYKRRDDQFFDSLASKARWNKVFPGKFVPTRINKKGYKELCLFRHTCMLHRVIWLLEKGGWPEYQIDHINGDRLDNRIENLRDVTSFEQARNRCMPKANKSGVVGVWWSPGTQKWVARVKLHGKVAFQGRFTSFEAAVAARKQAEADLGFHPNHGRPFSLGHTISHGSPFGKRAGVDSPTDPRPARNSFKISHTAIFSNNT